MNLLAQDTLQEVPMDEMYEMTTDVSAPPIPSSMAGPMAAFGIVPLVILLVVSLVSIIANWRIFSKAGKPGWASIVPIYNFIVFLQVIGRPAWWIVLFFIPFVNIAISIITALDTAKVFGKSALFGIILLWFFPIGYFILAFGSAKYTAPGGAPSAPSNPSTPVNSPAAPAPQESEQVTTPAS